MAEGVVAPITLDAATGLGTDAGSATCPPHPASAIKAAKAIRAVLGRNSFFTSLILGNSLRVAGFLDDWRSEESIEKQSRCGNFVGPELSDYREGTTPLLW